jgi:hypothetical protein
MWATVKAMAEPPAHSTTLLHDSALSASAAAACAAPNTAPLTMLSSHSMAKNHSRCRTYPPNTSSRFAIRAFDCFLVCQGAALWQRSIRRIFTDLQRSDQRPHCVLKRQRSLQRAEIRLPDTQNALVRLQFAYSGGSVPVSWLISIEHFDSGPIFKLPWNRSSCKKYQMFFFFNVGAPH